jgi:hypothetical protein
MIHPERAASDEADAVARPAGQHPAVSEGTPGTRTHQALAWEELYRTISPEEQRELLGLAERQGVLYAHQLPRKSNGTTTDTSRKTLARILDGAVADLQPVFAEPVEVGDHELDATQREAVAKALATPDVFLLQGRPGSGKSRVVAEIISCAASQGQRVLLLAPTAAAIDRVLGLLAGRDFVFPVRCVDRDENLAALPPTVRGLTLTERACALHRHALECARRQAEWEEQRAGRLRLDGASWPRLEELARQWQVLEEQSQVLEKQRSRLAIEVADQANAAQSATDDSFTTLVRDLTRVHQEASVHTERCLVDLRARIDAGRQEQAALDTESQVLQPLIDAKQQGRWWTGAWWRTTLRGHSIMTRWTQLQERREKIQRDLDAMQEQSAVEDRKWEEAKNAYAAKRSDLIAAEVARRQADLEDAEAVVRREQNILRQKWQEGCRGLAADSSRPAAITVQAVQAGRADCCRRAEQAEAQHALTRQWLTYLEQTPHALTPRLPGYVNLVAATIKALHRDEHFGDQAAGTAGQPDFDLLVLEEADQVAEPEFLQAARRARQCVLIGSAEWPEQSTPASPDHHAGTRERKGSSSGIRVRAALPRSGVFQRLWQLLHCDPRKLPYAWTQEGNRLCCRLRQLAKEQRQWLTTEHVADFPEIELRILAVPGCRPTLAEVVFPSAFSIDRAKQYIFQELEELAVQASGATLHWSTEADRLIVRLAERDLAHSLTIDLIPGVREILGTSSTAAHEGRILATGSETCCLEFDRAAGWDRPRAMKWMQQHVGMRDLGRTVCLDACYRMEMGLSAVVSDFLFAVGVNGEATCRIQQVGRNGRSGSFEFVPVPAECDSPRPQARDNGGAGRRGMETARPGSRAAMASRKGGAGLELDLSDPRHRARLPAEVRNQLPNQGFVNYAEAQAVVQNLAELFSEGIDELGGDHQSVRRQPAVAVLALYPAQADLINLLVRQDPALAALDHAIEVAVPYAFRHREAKVVLLSLTRSHTHRAVAFGDGPQTLALALTRARSKLVIFGDPGTLLRRSQWEGSLEHLNEDAAARERHLITRLMHSLPGGGSHSQAVSSHT